MKSLVRRKLEMAARVREFGRAHVKMEPGFGPALARLEERLTHAKAFDARLQESLKAVRSARTQRLKLRRGIQDASLAELTTLLGDFEAATETVSTARRAYNDAREDFEAICIDLMELVKLIGGITGYRFGNDCLVMTEWRAARHIPRAPRAVDRGVTPPSDVRPAA